MRIVSISSAGTTISETEVVRLSWFCIFTCFAVFFCSSSPLILFGPVYSLYNSHDHEFCVFQYYLEIDWPRWWRSGLERSPRKRKVGCTNPSCVRPKTLKQVVTASLTTARHYVWAPRVLDDDHYKRMPRFTVGAEHYRTLTAQWP